MTSKLFLSTPLLASLSAFPRKSKPFSRPVIVSCKLQNEAKDLIRPTAGFHPTLWGDCFTSYVDAEQKVSAGEKEEDVSKTKEYIRRELMATKGNPSKTMKFIADIQRLGVGYHFEKEIEEALTHIYETHLDDEVNDNNLGDLYDVSLRFRLLRLQGFDISCDIFNKFKGENGKLNESLAGDIHGMLGLYEAAHMGKHGEAILDEAIVFTTAHLREAIETNPGLQANPPLLSQVKHALALSIRRNIDRLEARYYMSVYDQIDSYDEKLLEFAKTDFNMVQSLHTMELSDITGWWKLNLAAKLPFARHRIVETHLWVSALITEPQYSYGRIILTKVLKMVSYIDDAIDTYGTFEENQLFADAFERWDDSNKDHLPEYMQIICKTTFDLFVEIEEEMARQGRPYFNYIKEAFIDVTRAYFQEAKWRHEEYVPTMEEYVANGIVTSICPLACVLIALHGAKGVGTKESVDWLLETPVALRAPCIIIRFRNDVLSHKRERESRGDDVVTSVECYMKEYGVSQEQAYEGIKNIISSEWKHLNGECLELRNHVALKDAMKSIVNLVCAQEVFYTEQDAFTHVSKALEAHIASVFIDSVPI